jgi:hypothetical protein
MEVRDMESSNRLTSNILHGVILGGALLLLGGCSDGDKENTARNDKFIGFNEEVLAVADAGDSKLYVGGYFSVFNHQTVQGLARVKRDGTLDKGFFIGKGFDNAVYTIAPANDGSDYLYVGGDFSRYDNSLANNIIRLKSDGSRDHDFDMGMGFDSRVEVIVPALDGSGDIYVGGRFTHYQGVAANHLIRLNSDGTVDKAFNTGRGANDMVRAIVPTNDDSGDLYIAGEFTAYNDIALKHIARLNADGTAEVSFNSGIGFDREVFALALVNDKSHDIYVGGWFHHYDGKQAAHLVRLTETGALNSQFDVQPFDGEGEQYISSLVTLDDCSGSVYVGGSFSSYAGRMVNGLIRLNGRGDIDRHFKVGITPVDAYVNSMVSDVNGDLYVGGLITPDLSKQSNFILHLHQDGSQDIAYNNRKRKLNESTARAFSQTTPLRGAVL